MIVSHYELWAFFSKIILNKHSRNFGKIENEIAK